MTPPAEPNYALLKIKTISYFIYFWDFYNKLKNLTIGSKTARQFHFSFVYLYSEIL